MKITETTPKPIPPPRFFQIEMDTHELEYLIWLTGKQNIGEAGKRGFSDSFVRDIHKTLCDAT